MKTPTQILLILLTIVMGANCLPAQDQPFVVEVLPTPDINVDEPFSFQPCTASGGALLNGLNYYTAIFQRFVDSDRIDDPVLNALTLTPQGSVNDGNSWFLSGEITADIFNETRNENHYYHNGGWRTRHSEGYGVNQVERDVVIDVVSQVFQNGIFPEDRIKFTLVISTSLTIETESLPTVLVGTPYETPLSISGGTGNYDVSANLPEGLSIRTIGQGNFSIEGTVVNRSLIGTTHEIMLRVHDDNGAGVILERELELKIYDEFEITTSTLPPARAQSPYTPLILGASGGLAPYDWSQTTGLPSGLEVVNDAPDTWNIVGTPIRASARIEPYEVSLVVTDAFGGRDEIQLDLVVYDDLEIRTARLPRAQEGAFYDVEVETLGSGLPFVWSIDGLPDGLDFVTSDSNDQSFLRGTPVFGSEGTFTIRMTVTDSYDVPQTSTTALSLIVLAPAEETPLDILNTHLPPFTETEQGNPITLQAGGGVAPYTWEVQGLPPGLNVVQVGNEWHIDGAVSRGYSGQYNVLLIVSDAASSTASAIFDFILRPIPSDETPYTESTPAVSPGTLLAAPAAGACTLNHDTSLMWLFLAALFCAFRISRGYRS